MFQRSSPVALTSKQSSVLVIYVFQLVGGNVQVRGGHTSVEDQMMVLLDLRSVRQNGLECGFRALLSAEPSLIFITTF